LFSYCKLLIVEIKQCVLSPLSVSKPPPVVSPTNNWKRKWLIVRNHSSKDFYQKFDRREIHGICSMR